MTTPPPLPGDIRKAVIAQHLTSGKAVPQRPVGDASGPVERGAAPVGVVVRHGGVIVGVGASQPLESLGKRRSVKLEGR